MVLSHGCYSKSIIKDKTFNRHVPTSNGFKACHFFSIELMKREECLGEKKSHSLASEMARGEMTYVQII